MNISLTVFSGFGPLIATWSTAQAGGDARAASYFLMGCAVLALIGAYFLKYHQGHVMAGAGIPDHGPNRPARPLPPETAAAE